ncbi:MAG: 4Fe-4S binding protein, partial [Planctomycetota bacterium]|nr:4Fe-4S binding protein [Planctomycetota bacterium]
MKRRFPAQIRATIAFVFFAGFIVAFTIGGVAADAMRFAVGPAFMRTATMFTVSGMAIAAFALAATVVFGRFPCAALCPLGTIQEIADRKKRLCNVPNLKWFRYAAAAVSLILVTGGWNRIFGLIEPFSRIGAMLSSGRAFLLEPMGFRPFAAFLIGCVAPLCLVVGLASWKRRVYCATICPVGSILGLFSARGVFGVRFAEACSGCGKCERICPTGCLDASRRAVDTERCILCLNCLGACPNGGIGYGRTSRTALPAPDASRRAFLAKGIMVVAGAVAAGAELRKLTESPAFAGGEPAGRIYPPGAGDPSRFQRACTGCRLCAASCPTGIIQPTGFGFGPVRLDYSHGACDYNCNRCSAVCPTGALQPLSLADKRYLRIGRAEVDLNLCRVVTESAPCDLCAKAC